MGQFLQGGENKQNLVFFLKKMKRYCDLTVWFFQLFSIFLEILCPFSL